MKTFNDTMQELSSILEKVKIELLENIASEYETLSEKEKKRCFLRIDFYKRMIELIDNYIEADSKL